MIAASLMKELNYYEVLTVFVLTELSCSYYERVIHTFQESLKKVVNGEVLDLYLKSVAKVFPPLVSCEIGRSFADPSLEIPIYSIGISHWVGHGGHMNTY